jgi:tetratricopeptide (TPR) repeat protein
MKFRLKLFSILATALIFSDVAVATAAGKEDKTKAQENEARAACLLGDYKKGAEILVKLFIQTNRAVYIFNQGRCYQQNHRWEEAIDRFREFLRKAPDLEDAIKAQVRKRVQPAQRSGRPSPAAGAGIRSTSAALTRRCWSGQGRCGSEDHACGESFCSVCVSDRAIRKAGGLDPGGARTQSFPLRGTHLLSLVVLDSDWRGGGRRGHNRSAALAK